MESGPRRDPIDARNPTHLPLCKDLVLIMRPVKPHSLHQLRLPKLLLVFRSQRARPHDGHVPEDFPLMAHQARGPVGRQARLGVESARVPVDVVVPRVGAGVVVELADLDRSLPAAVAFELALFRGLVAEVGEVEGLDLGRDVVGDGRCVRGRLGRCGAEDVAVRFGGGGVGWTAGGLAAGGFVGGPVGLLTVSGAVSGTFAPGAFAGAWLRARGIGAHIEHDGD